MPRPSGASIAEPPRPSAQWDTTGATGDVFVGIIALKESGGTVYDLTVDPASYTLTAAAETLTATRALSIDPAAYTLTAADVELEYASSAKELIVEPASYVLSLADVALEYSSSTQEPQESYSTPTKRKKKTYNYDYSSPKEPEAVEPAKQVKAVKQKAKKVIPADVAEMMQLLEASQSVTAEVLSEQMAMRAAEEQRFAEEEEMLAVIALCL